MPWLGREPGPGPAGRCPGQPGILDDLGELGQRELADPARPDQHRGMPVEVRCSEERRVRVLDQRLLVGLRRHPEHDDVRVPLTAIRVNGVRPRGTEEHERPAADLVDRVALRPMLHRDLRHARRQLVHVLDQCPPLAHDHPRSPVPRLKAVRDHVPGSSAWRTASTLMPSRVAPAAPKNARTAPRS